MFVKATLIAVAIACCLSVGYAITEEQMRKSTDAVRLICQPKNKVSDELVNGVPKGNFPDDKGLKCYTHCVMEMMGIMKKSKIMKESAMKQFDLLLPDDFKEPYRNALGKCEDSVKGISGNCEVAYAFTQCFYKNNEKFLFP